MQVPANLLATIFDLTRRVADLEAAQGVGGRGSADLVLLLRCYRDAHAFLRGVSAEQGSAWVATAYLWDVRMLLDLGRAVEDPYPYRPLLAVLDRCVLVGIPGAIAGRARFEAVAQDLLRAVGLELIRPRDTMRRLAIHDVHARLARR